MSDIITNTVSVSANADNMALWNSVCKTNPAHTKPAKIGGMSITAISPQYQIQSATEQFGPYGSSWGLKNIDRSFELLEALGLVIFSGVFFYPGGEFEISTSHSIYMDKNKTMVDKDFCKKMETDLMTKALSKIGFNADVFMGRYDDVRYVNELKEEFNKPATISQPQQNHLVQLIQDSGLNVEDFLTAWQISHLSELHLENVDNAFNWVSAQAKHRQQEHEQPQTVNRSTKTKMVEQDGEFIVKNTALGDIADRQNRKNKQAIKRQDYEQQQHHEAQQHANHLVNQYNEKNQKAAGNQVHQYVTPKEVQELRHAIHLVSSNVDGFNEEKFCKISKIRQIGMLPLSRFEGAIDWLFTQCETVRQTTPPRQQQRDIQPSQYQKRTERYQQMGQRNAA